MCLNAARDTNQGGTQFAAMIAKCALKPSNCQQTMTREYFALLGRLLSTPGGKELMDTSATRYASEPYPRPTQAHTSPTPSTPSLLHPALPPSTSLTQ